jgi:acetyl-CoA carboxylase carboxyl transferase subunit beta
MECGMMVASGTINNIKITAVASDFDFLGASMAAAEGEAFLYGIQHAIENRTPFLCISAGRWNENDGKFNFTFSNDKNNTCN